MLQFGQHPTFSVSANFDAATAVDRDVWVCPNLGCKYRLVSVQAVWDAVGGAGAAVRPRRITDTSASGAAASSTVLELTTATFDLTGTVRTVNSGTLSATETDLLFAPGNRLGLNFSGTQTGLIGLNLVFIFEPYENAV